MKISSVHSATVHVLKMLNWMDPALPPLISRHKIFFGGDAVLIKIIEEGSYFNKKV